MCCLYYHVKLNQHMAMEVLKACLFTAAQVQYELDYQLFPSHPRPPASSFSLSSFPRFPSSPSCSLCFSSPPSSPDLLRGPLAAEEEKEEKEEKDEQQGPRDKELASSQASRVLQPLACSTNKPRTNRTGSLTAIAREARANPRDARADMDNLLSELTTDVTPPLSMSEGDAVHAAAVLAAEAAAGAAAAAAAAAEAAAAADCAGGGKMAEAAAKTALAAQAAAEAEAKTAAAQAAAAAFATEKTVWGAGKTVWGGGGVEEQNETNENGKARRGAPMLVDGERVAGFSGERPSAAVQGVEGQADERKRGTPGDEGGVIGVILEAEGEVTSEGGMDSPRLADRVDSAFGTEEKAGHEKEACSTMFSPSCRPPHRDGSAAGSDTTSTHTRPSSTSKYSPRPTGSLTASRSSPRDPLDAAAFRENSSSSSNDRNEAARGRLSEVGETPFREDSRFLREAKQTGGKEEKEAEKGRDEGLAKLGGGQLFAQGVVAGHVHAEGNAGDGFGFPRWSDVVVLQILQNRPVFAAALLSDVLAALLRGKATVQSMCLESVDLPCGDLGERGQCMEIKVKFPATILPLQTKVLSDRPGIKFLEDELKNICRRHDAHTLLRRDDFALKRRCRSLVVFGLNEVLVEQDVSREILQEHGGVAGEERMYMRKLTKLEGVHAADLIKKVLPHLNITRGAFFLLYVLKKLGVRTALMTHSCQEVAHCVGRLLGVDYVLSNHFEVRDGRLTGRVVGGSSSSEVTTSHMLDPLRKMDWLQLLRDKERLERDALFVIANYENFDFLHGAAGVCWSFNARRNRDVSKFLLLLGVKQRHLQEFYARFRACSLQGALEDAYPLGLTALIQKHQENLLAQLLQPGLLSTCVEEREAREQMQQAVLPEQDEAHLQLQEAEEQQRLENNHSEVDREGDRTTWSPHDSVAVEPESAGLRGETAKLLETGKGEEKDALRRASQNGKPDRSHEELESDKESRTEKRHYEIDQGALYSLAGGGLGRNVEREGGAGGRCKTRDPLLLCERGVEISECSFPPSPPTSFISEGRRAGPIRSDSNIFEVDRFQRPRGTSSSARSVSSAGGPGAGGGMVSERRVDRAVVCVYGQVRADDATPHIWRIAEALRPFEQGRGGGGASGACTPASTRTRVSTSACGIEALQLVNLHHHICLGMTVSWTSTVTRGTSSTHRLTSAGSSRSETASSYPSFSASSTAAVAAAALSNGMGGGMQMPLASSLPFPAFSASHLSLPALSSAPSPLQNLSPVKEILFAASCLGLRASFIPQSPVGASKNVFSSPPASWCSHVSGVKGVNSDQGEGTGYPAAGRILRSVEDKANAKSLSTRNGCHPPVPSLSPLSSSSSWSTSTGGLGGEDKREKSQVQEDLGPSDDSARRRKGDESEPAERSFYLVIMEEPSVSPQLLVHVFAMLFEQLINIEEIDKLSMYVAKAIRLRLAIGPAVDVQQLKKQLLCVCSEFGADVALQADDISRYCLRLVVFDMDSTLVCEEVIDELAREAGVMKQVAAITQAAMEGQLDFHASLMKRVRMLKGIKRSALDAVAARLTPTPGAAELCRVLRHLGYRLAVISGGFTYFARKIKKLLRLHHAFANHLQIDPKTGAVTGEVEGPVVTAQRKVSLMRMLAEVEQVEVDQVIAVGDGSNDIPLLLHAGMGIAFCAKKRVKENSNYQLNQRNLFLLVHLLGISEKAALQLAQEECRDD
ncbi:phosphoserine phosphatase [Cystoisospora suis]|uniref:phosphoserine phosphatase n=1 Tax=Cystoisospora suis TaxID=483139 RepID=A0A2C6KNL3_9APIC|nr:phosphoserine phosphatase [Cystoisospora suis]